jgi:hypothetical protein
MTSTSRLDARAWWLLAVLGATCTAAWATTPSYQDFDRPPHRYWERTPSDRFSRLRPDLESGRVALDRDSELAFLASLLRALEVPAGSQTLVFSTTSLQLGLISPRRPRAIYFNEDTYVGYVPGGKIEVISLDPDLGGVFYIFPIPRETAPLAIERATTCMNCHAGEDTREVPGLVIKSVIPGPRGGSLTAYRTGDTGHHLPLAERFGGWVITGLDPAAAHHGNVTGQLSAEGLRTFPVEPGKTFDWGGYLVPRSDVLAHLLHEHQAGFVNRVVEGTYRARAARAARSESLDPSRVEELDRQAREIARYVLFADEAPLPQGGIQADPEFRGQFLASRKATAAGAALKDLDLKTRLFKYRCSYMIYSPVFAGMPDDLKFRVFTVMRGALDPGHSDPAFGYLAAGEKSAIRQILNETLSGVPQPF